MAIATETFSATPTGWTRVRGSLALSRVTADDTGAAVSSTASNETFRRDVDLGGVDQFSECDVVGAGADANRSVFVCARMGTGSTPSFYSAVVNANARTMTLLRYANPTSASPLTPTTTITIPTAPFKLRLEVEGSAVRSLLNGEVILTATDSTIGSGTFGGLAFYNCGSGTLPPLRVDNWRAGLLADDVPGPPPGRFLIASV